jgi:hypothetical protein
VIANGDAADDAAGGGVTAGPAGTGAGTGPSGACVVMRETVGAPRDDGLTSGWWLFTLIG